MFKLIFVFSVIQHEPLKYKDYVYPWYAELIGWLLAFSSVGLVPVYAIYKVLKNIGNLKSVRA